MLKQSFVLFCSLLSLNVMASTPVTMKYTLEREENKSENSKKNNVLLPYVFSTESMGVNAGIGFLSQGLADQEQFAIGGTAYKGGSDSYAFSLGFWNYQIKESRFFLSSLGFYGHYPEQTAYGGGSFIGNSVDDPFPGSSDSTKEQYIRGKGYSNWLDLKLEYVLPIGRAESSFIKSYKTRGGILKNEEKLESWNPFKTGTTTAIARGFYHYQSYDENNLNSFIDGKTSGLELGIQYDNTDFSPNPSKGSRQYLAFTRDGKIMNDEIEWSFLEAELSKYISLGSTDMAKQRILALNLWTGYSPSWKIETTNDSLFLQDAPPFNEGGTLGGWNRMRGYESHRFHDKAVLYGAAEYRYTLDYNPFSSLSYNKYFGIDWIQLVGFAEIGQVAPSYNLSDLTSNMKYDYGLSIRAFVSGLVVRTDFAHSEEGNNLWVMVAHPF